MEAYREIEGISSYLRGTQSAIPEILYKLLLAAVILNMTIWGKLSKASKY